MLIGAIGTFCPTPSVSKPYDQSATAQLVEIISQQSYGSNLVEQNKPIQSLLDKNADPDAQDPLRFGLLHLGALRGNVELIQLALNAGADIHALGDWGFAPVHWAVYNLDNIPCLELLVEKKADIRHDSGASENVVWWRPLHLAADKGNLEAVRFLIDCGVECEPKDHHGRQALHLAALNGHVQVINLLLQKRAEVDAADDIGYQALHYATAHVDVMESLLNYRANIDAADNHGQQALHLAAKEGRVDATKLLLARGADHTAKNNAEHTHAMLGRATGNANVADLLSEHALRLAPQ